MLLKFMLNDGYYPNLIVCPPCWEPRHPQESLPNVEDPVTLYRPAPENLPAPTSPVLTGTLVDNDGRIIVTTIDGVTSWQSSVDGTVFASLGITAIGRKIRWFSSIGRWLVAAGAQILWSTDGETFHVATASGLANVVDIDYSPSLDVAVAIDSTGTILFSLDRGSSWSVAAGFTSQTFSALRWDATIVNFVVVASGGNPSNQRSHYSPDGQNFTLTVSLSSQSYSALTSDGTRYVAAHGLTSFIANQTSLNAQTWAGGSTMVRNNAGASDFGLGLFVFQGQDGTNNTILRSATGVAAYAESIVGVSATLGNPRDVRADPTRSKFWYLSQNRLHKSTDATATAWTQALAGTQFGSVGVRP
jgi:hypothetical protein